MKPKIFLKLIHSQLISELSKLIDPGYIKNQISESENKLYSEPNLIHLCLINFEKTKNSTNLSKRSTVLFSISQLVDIKITYSFFYSAYFVHDIKISSKFVCEEFYTIRYSDILISKTNPVIHFWTLGYSEKRFPCPELAPKLHFNNLNEIYMYLSHNATDSLFLSYANILRE